MYNCSGYVAGAAARSACQFTAPEPPRVGRLRTPCQLYSVTSVRVCICNICAHFGRFVRN